jgi:hypothetical protein
MPGVVIVAALRPETTEADHVGDLEVVFWLEPAFPGERIAGLGHGGCPRHVRARGRDRDHRPQHGLVKVLHRDGAAETGPVAHRKPTTIESRRSARCR